jgi:hypothetical protein
MSKQSQIRSKCPSAVVRECLPALRAVALTLDTYGDRNQALKLRSVVDELQNAFPFPPFTDVMCFVVNGTFKVTRRQVAATLFHAFGSEVDWLEVTKTGEPPALHFQTIKNVILRLVDYPLNEGGWIDIIQKSNRSQIHRLDLESIAAGLEVLANHYPRHFADLINENADHLTADALAQCCLFGEIIINKE